MGKVGRPTKYEKDYCIDVIDHMEQGYSFESFAGLVGVAKSTLYEWQDRNPEFSDAVKIAFEKCRLFWEKEGIKGLWSGNGSNFNSTNWIFQMKNRFKDEWREKQEFDHSSSDGSMATKPTKIVFTDGVKTK